MRRSRGSHLAEPPPVARPRRSRRRALLDQKSTRRPLYPPRSDGDLDRESRDLDRPPFHMCLFSIAIPFSASHAQRCRCLFSRAKDYRS
jgi:hypothetical protein